MNTDTDFRCPVCGSDDVYLEAYFTKHNGDKDWGFSEAGQAFCNSCGWQDDWDLLVIAEE